MDTSETYLKMCDCPEMQELYWDTSENQAVDISKDFSVEIGISGGIRYIWLPRQDQLQEMLIVKTHPMPILNLGWRFQTFFNEQYSELNQATPPALFTSMEQLWLAFVMKEKFNKVWNGDQWL